jgi:hypothetical protein
MVIRRTAGGCSSSISDDFSGTDAKWTHLTGSGWTVGGGLLVISDEASYIYDDEETCNISQWASVERVDESSYQGIYLRSDNNASNYAYAFRWTNGAPAAAVDWRYCLGHSCTTIESTSSVQLDIGDCLGVEIDGTGDDTVARIWDLGAGPCTAHASWGTADATLTNNPTNAADVGKYTGTYCGAAGSGQMDTFAAGEWE